MNTSKRGIKKQFLPIGKHGSKPTVIAVIGSGAIGRHHLEALSLMDRPVALKVVDPSSAALMKTKRALQEALTAGQIIAVDYRHNMEGLPPRLDLAVIAVTADVRCAVLEDLLSRVTVPYLILEKVLFQKLSDYTRVRELLELSVTKAWVNCPLRTVDYFKLLRCQTEGRPLHYSLSASNLGLGCNSIHHLDLFAYLCGRNDISLDSSLLDEEIVAAKRPGFMEFTGTLSGHMNDGGTLRITSYRWGNVPPLLTISCESVRLIYRINEQRAWIAGPWSGWHWCSFYLPFPKQSRITHLAAGQILNEGVSDLPSFEESAQLHLLLLQTFLQKTGLREWKEKELCPIT